MSMTKRDYQAIAAAIYRTRQEYPAFSQNAVAYSGKSIQSPADAITAELANVMQADNPRFSRERFLEACETGRTKGMRQV